jgi:hypothetical protein
MSRNTVIARMLALREGVGACPGGRRRMVTRDPLQRHAQPVTRVAQVFGRNAVMRYELSRLTDADVPFAGSSLGCLGVSRNRAPTTRLPTVRRVPEVPIRDGTPR